MCGIAGVIRPGGLDERELIAMRDALAHRGPDDAGCWISDDGQVGLAQRRLSIIDLSASGHQPMRNEDGTVWIVFNGEIYDHTELRHRLEQRGHRFRSRSDTEAIIHAYEEWGDDCVTRFRGMFAFGLWDTARHRLVLARDHAGIKPLFYYWDGRTFAFASEIKAFWALTDTDREIDRSALFDYLTYLYVPAPKTAYAHIRKLEPGHTLRFDGSGVTRRQYWDIPLEQDDALTEARAIELVQDHLSSAVATSMVSDVPVGAFLSGGVDSSTVVSYMAERAAGPVHTYAIGFDVPEHSETAYARQIAELYRTAHCERTVGFESARAALPRMIELYDEPYCDSSAIPTLRVAELARDEVKVVLSGDGGDEVFAGYRWYERWLRQQRFARRIPTGWGRRATAAIGRRWPDDARGKQVKHFLEGIADDPLAQYARQMELLTPQEKRAVLGPAWSEEFADYDDYWYYRQYWRPEVDDITRLQYLDVKTYLPDDILTKVDRASMAVGLEVRPPLLDHILMEAVFRVPASIRFKQAQKKYLLKRAVADRLPTTIIDRGKKGFSSPLTQWMVQDRSWVEDSLRASARIVRADATRHIGARLWGHKCWALLVLEQWAAGERLL